jgi:hypothetical protein
MTSEMRKVKLANSSSWQESAQAAVVPLVERLRSKLSPV